ncbi:hypothetical protein MTR67_030890, partial [Solanum verrucosum]
IGCGPMNQNVRTVPSRAGYFTRINPPEFHDSKVEEFPQDFIDEVYNVLIIMGVTPVEKVELAAEGGKGSSNALALKFNKDRVSNPKPQGGNSGGSSLSTCAKRGKKHENKCLASSNRCFGCGMMDHKKRDCPAISKSERDNR